ncbi:hypothetical protein QP202_24300, partial [Escherichia coli]|nr:hypothetical protein [Escherichia coli]
MGSCAAPSAKGDDKFITTDYLQQCPAEINDIFNLTPLMANFVLGRLPCCVTSLLLHNIKHRPTA